ncbi:MAG: ABC transporter permease subunit, partial [Alphaproteobacteria bacterium]|nr:ABC transporter permease subunit [Alphaproteobacteria bacterium]
TSCEGTRDTVMSGGVRTAGTIMTDSHARSNRLRLALAINLVIVAVQVYNFDPVLEDAARDCGATTWEVYRHVTIPLLWPGIFSAAIFAFLLSWGNFYITYSLAGSTRTIPTFIFSGIAVGSSPLYPAIATVVFIPGILLVILANRFRIRAAAA